MPGHRHRRGVPDGGVPHVGRALGAKINAMHHGALAESTGIHPNVIHASVPEVAQTAIEAAGVEIDFEDDAVIERGRE